MLTVDTIPLRILSISNCQFSCLTQPTPNRQSEIGNRQRSLGLFVIRVFAAATAELTKLQPLGRSLFVLGRYVVTALANRALQHDVVTRHKSSLCTQYLVLCALQFPTCALSDRFRDKSKSKVQRSKSYSTISETVPAPTVRPPSRIANRKPFSMAIGAINSMSIVTLSPGITISTPVGRWATPVTSVVRK